MVIPLIIFGTVLACATILAYIVGSYMAMLITNDPWLEHSWYSKVETRIFSVLGVAKTQPMDWKRYFFSLVTVNAITWLFIFLVLIFQGYLPLNPTGIKGLSVDLAFHTSVSFITNTNLQHYNGEKQLSLFSQLLAIMVPMFIAPASSIAAAFAFIRAFVYTKTDLGNFYVDFFRIISTILLPISSIMAIILLIFGLPQSLDSYTTFTTLEGLVDNMTLGPLASYEAIKILGNNGGGYFGANSSYPFENANGITNAIEIVLMLVFPMAFPIAFGKIIGRRRGLALLSTILFGYLVVLFLGLIQYPNQTNSETRFFGFPTLFFLATSISTNTGATNAQLSSAPPFAVVGFLFAMFVQAIPGGAGASFMVLIIYIIIALFIVGLITGKTPEFIGYHIDPKEVKLCIGIYLLQPAIILIPTIISIATGNAQEVVGSPITSYGFTQVLYEYASAASNNGSDYFGASADTPFWNISTAIIMLIGRYVWIGLMLIIAGEYASKFRKQAIESIRIDSPVFVATLIAIIISLNIITYLPFLILGPLSM